MSEENFSLDGKQPYFLLDNGNQQFPLRVAAKGVVPEVNVKGQWQPYYNLTRFFAEAMPCTKEEFDEEVANQEARAEADRAAGA